MHQEEAYHDEPPRRNLGVWGIYNVGVEDTAKKYGSWGIWKLGREEHSEEIWELGKKKSEKWRRRNLGMLGFVREEGNLKI